MRREIIIPASVSLGVTALLVALFVFGYFTPARSKLTDLLFTNEKPIPDILLVAIDDQSITSIGQWPWPREVFAKGIDKLQMSKGIGIDVNFKEPSGKGAADDLALVQSLAKSKVPVILSAQIQPDGEITFPLQAFKDKSVQAFTNLTLSSDGVARFIQPNYSDMDSFGYALAKIKGVSEQFSSPARINYWGKDGTFSSVSFRDLISDKIPPSFIVGRVAIIGATAHDLQDYHQTPFGIMSGPEIQANIAQTFMSGIVYRSNKWVDIFSIIIMACMAVWLTFRMKFSYASLGMFVAFALYNFVAFIGFDHAFVMDLLYPNVALLLGGISSVSLQYVTASRERRFIRDSFNHYLAPQIINEIMADPSKLKLGGQRQRVTIMFSDIRGFTSMSENMEPEHLTDFLNKYLTKMSGIIMDNKGLIDKYIGDAIMAFWGAPLADDKQELNALLSAFAMSDALAEQNKNKPKDEPEIKIGIGLNTGEVAVGNMGSEKRFNYTIIGDAVNLSSRLEGLTKLYGITIIVSQGVIDGITEEDIKNYGIMTREIDQVRVKGKGEKVTIHQVVEKEYQEKTKSVSSEFFRGRELYYKGDWQGAISAFEKVLEKFADDGPSKVLLGRCQEFIKNPPKDWDGSYTLTEK